MGYFIIKSTSNDGFMFDLVADNNDIQNGGKRQYWS